MILEDVSQQSLKGGWTLGKLQHVLERALRTFVASYGHLWLLGKKPHTKNYGKMKGFNSKVPLPASTWCYKPGGGFKHFLFSPLLGEDFQFD